MASMYAMDAMEAMDRLTLVISILSLIPELLHECSTERGRDLDCLKEVEPALKIFQNYIENDLECSSEKEHIIGLIAHCLELMFSKSIGKRLEDVNPNLQVKDQYPRLHAVLDTFKLESARQVLSRTFVPFNNRRYWVAVINNMKRTVVAIESGIRDAAMPYHIPRVENRVTTGSVQHIRRLSDLCDKIHGALDCTCGDSRSVNFESYARLRLDLWDESKVGAAYESLVLVKEKGIWNELLISDLRSDSVDAEAAGISGLLCELLKQNDTPQTRSQKLRLKLESPSSKLDHIAFLRRYTSTGLGKEITLGELIDAKQGTEWQVATKLILAYTLASCLCYLNDGPWTKGGWNSSSIILDGDGTSVHPKPFLNTGRGSIFKHVAEPCTSQAKKTASHRFPDILELGRVLLEIYLGRRLEYGDTLDLCHNVKATFKDVLENPQPGALLDAIHACLRFFDTAIYPSSTVDDVRQDILTKVVRPLEQELQKLQVYQQWGQSLPKSIYERITTMEKLNIEATNQRQTSSQKGSDDWQVQFEYQWMELENSYGGKNKLPRLKVAILDSGIDIKHPRFQDTETKRRIMDHCSWVDEQPLTDNCGHGTHIAATMLRLSSNTELYIGKITKSNISNTADIRNLEAVVKGLRHARETWKVDMISLSFAFTGSEEDKSLVKAELTKCWQGQIAVFAAASNDGRDAPRAFPANQSHVLCIHAAFHDGTADKCNPIARPDEYNFSVLGCDICSAWPSLEGDMRYKTGTSFAVPVAICIAAFMAAYLEKYDQDCQSWLTPPKTAAGVMRMFKVMAGKIRFPDYDWISPCGYLGGKPPEDIVSSMKDKLDDS